MSQEPSQYSENKSFSNSNANDFVKKVNEQSSS